MKLKNRTLKEQIWFYMAIFSTALIALLWILQVLFFDTYYEQRTTKDLETLAYKTKYYYVSGKPSSYYDTLSYNNNACIEIIEDNTSIYSSNGKRRGCIYVDDNVELSTNYILDFMESNLNSKNYKIINPKLDNKTLVTGIKLDDGVFAFINVSLEPTDPAISIIREELIYITIFIYISSFIIAYFISKHVTKPIKGLMNGATKMSKGDLITPFDENSNIIEIKELSKTLNHAKKELSKLETTRRDLLANVSHDLKTPLTMIKAYAEMARDLNKDNEEKRNDNLSVIIEEADRLNLLVNDILELSKSERNIDILMREDFSLNKLIETILHRFDYLREEGYDFEFIFKHEYTINADKQKIEQVIYNLISNAINYTGKDKKITVKIEDKKSYIRVYIIDTGKGIDKEELDLIWDKYYKNEKNHTRNKVGTGLGLSIVKNILIKHGYNYGVESTKGKGTKFYFDINI